MIYERDKADSKREGYQIRLGSGSQAGFRACLTNAHIDKITAKLGQSSGSQATAPSIYNTQFDEILDLAHLPTYSKSAAINRVVLRDMLLEPIKKIQRIQYKKRFDRYEIVTRKDSKESVKVCFSDGSHDFCDVLVGADGANSKASAVWQRQVCLEAIKDWAPEFHRMLSVGEEDPEKTEILVTQLRASTQPKKSWRTWVPRAGNDEGHPRVWVMGDAFHAMQPNRGQGGKLIMPLLKLYYSMFSQKSDEEGSLVL
ncbi:hypothetical protein B5807_08713 [Epicoccum nigrum]|uniref:FAD-binding domain-containing protein n=1 Tax=Epicoccum nigrum TaxID=105696 RepID=A0A1Y2LTN9_EPING|nr:hypothetical protein B5807_08713 [Epicoccum nigrum]